MGNVWIAIDVATRLLLLPMLLPSTFSATTAAAAVATAVPMLLRMPAQYIRSYAAVTP